MYLGDLRVIAIMYYCVLFVSFMCSFEVTSVCLTAPLGSPVSRSRGPACGTHGNFGPAGVVALPAFDTLGR